MRLFAFFGGLLLLALIAALLGPLFINWSDYKDQFEREAQRLTGLPVTVQGEANVRLLPFPSLSFSDLRIGADEQPVLVADRLSMDAELAPFLTGELRIVDMRLDGAVATLDLDETGALILPGRDRTPQALELLQDIEIERALISNSTIRIRQNVDNDPRRWQLTGVDGTLAIDSLAGPFRFEGGMVFNGVPAQLFVSTGLLGGEGLSLNTRSQWPNRGVRIATQGRIEPSGDGQIYQGVFQLDTLGEAQVPFFVEGDFAADNSSIIVEQYRASFGQGDNPYRIEGDFSLRDDQVRPDYALTARGVQLDLGAISPDDGATPLSVWSQQAQDLFQRLPLPNVPGAITIDLPAVVSGDTVIRDVRFVARAGAVQADGSEIWEIAHINALLPGRTVLEGSGEIMLPHRDAEDATMRFTGPLVVASRQPSGLATWLGYDNSDEIRALARAGFEGTVTASAAAWRIDDLSLIVDTDRLTGMASFLPETRPKPLASLVLTGDALSANTQAIVRRMLTVRSDTALPFDADLAFDLTNLVVDGVAIGRFDTGLRLRESTTSIDRLLVQDIAGADVSATATIERTNQEMQTRFDVSLVSANAGPFLQNVPGILPLMGMSTDETIAARLATLDARYDDTTLTFEGIHRRDDTASSFETTISGMTGGTQIDGSLTLNDGVQFTVSAQNPSALRLGQQVGVSLSEIAGAGDLSVELTGTRAEGLATHVTARMGTMEARFEGQLDQSITASGQHYGVDGIGQINGVDIGDFWAALGMPFAVQSDSPVRFEAGAQMSWQQGSPAQAEQMHASIGDQIVTGNLVADWQGGTLEVVGDVTMQQLDMTSLLLPFLGMTEQAGAFSEPETGLPNIDVQLHADALRLGGQSLQLNDFAGQFTHTPGQIAVRSFQAKLFEDDISGSLDLQNLGGEVTTRSRLAIANLPLAQMGSDAVDGAVSVGLSVVGNGRSVDALMGSLTGSGVAQTSPIIVSGLGSDRFAPFIEAVDVIGFEITEADVERLAAQELLRGQTQFNPVEVPFVIAGGAADISNVILNEPSGALSVTVNGGVSLIDGVSEAAMTARYDASDIDMSGLSPSIGLRWNGQEMVIDTSMLATFVTQRAIEREQQRIDALQARILERQRLRRAVRIARYERDQRLAREEARRLAAEEAERRAAEEAARRAEQEAQAVVPGAAPAFEDLQFGN